jgi:hypothetical protein
VDSKEKLLPDIRSFALALPLAHGYADLGLREYNKFAEIFGSATDRGAALPHEKYIEAIPIATLLAFAAELYLKVLVFQRTGSYPRGHELKKIVRKIPPQTLSSLKRHYDECVQRPGRPIKLTYKINPDNQRVSPQPFLPDPHYPPGDSFEQAIIGASPLFEKLRYLHEEIAVGFCIDIDFSWLFYLLDATRSEILSFQDGEVKINFSNRHEKT